MKQTAVEWLVEQLVVMDKQLDGRRKNEDATVMKMNPTKIVEQAKEMEKQQQGYSEEEVLALIKARQMSLMVGISGIETQLWFEQFRKK